jgi:AcrR family transcriptional regulator
MSETAPDKTTRERILDVALELFMDKGYDKTSLREIAERMGFTKAALYYHFASKSDMLIALHLRLHALLEDALDELGDGPTSIAAWEEFLNEAIDKIEANRPLFAMHQRNQSAFEDLHHQGHEGKHQDIEDRLRTLLSDPSHTTAERVRLAAAFSATFFTSMLTDVFGDTGDGEFARALREVVHDILSSSGATLVRGAATAPGAIP